MLATCVTDSIFCTRGVGDTSTNSPPRRRSVVAVRTSSPRPRASMDVTWSTFSAKRTRPGQLASGQPIGVTRSLYLPN